MSGAAPPAPHTSLNEPPSSVWHFLSLLLLGIIPIAVNLLLAVFGASLHFQETYILLACMGFFTLAYLLNGPIEEGVWAGYVNFAVLMTWLCLGLPAAIGAVVGGLVMALAIRLRLSRFLNLTPFRSEDQLRQSAERLLMCGGGLGAAAGVYALSGGSLPLSHLNVSGILALGAALLASLSATQVIGLLLSSRQEELTSLMRRNQRRMVAELSLLVLVVCMPLILYGAGELVFVLVLFAVATQAIRYQQIRASAQASTHLYDQSAELVQKLALINRSAQNAMFNFDPQQAMKIACQTAMDVTYADGVAIFLLNREQDVLTLEESIGLSNNSGPDIRKQYPPRRYDDGAYIVTDIHKTNHEPLDVMAQQADFESFVEMPLRSGQLTLGCLAVYHKTPRIYTGGDLDLLEIVSNQVATALDNAQLVRVLEMYTFETTNLVYLSNISNSSMELSKVTADIAQVMRQMMAMDWVMIMLLDKNSERMRVLAVDGDEDNTAATAYLTPFPEFAQINGRPLVAHRDSSTLSEPLQKFIEAHNLTSIALAPMIAHQMILGAVVLGKRSVYETNERDEQLLQTAANQIATQLYNTLLYNKTYDALKQQLEQLAVIERIVQDISSSRDSTEIIRDVFEAAVKTTQADMVALALLTDADDFWTVIQHYQDGVRVETTTTRQRIDEGVIGEVLKQGEFILTEDNSRLPYYVTSPPYEYHSSLAVPLTKDDRIAGVLNVESRHLDFFTPEQADFLKSLGGHAIISIENARLLEELQYQIEALTNLRELSLNLSSAVDTSSVAKAVLKTALSILHGQHAAIFNYSINGDRLSLLASIESGELAARKPLETDILRQVARRAATTGKTQAVEDITEEKGYILPPVINYPSLITVPIKRGNQVNEVLCVVFAERQFFENRDLNTLALLAGQAGGHLENAILHEQIRAGSDRMKAILDSTRDGVILLDGEARLVEVNPSAQRLLNMNLSDHLSERMVSVLLRSAESDDRRYAGYTREELESLMRLERFDPESITRREFEQETVKGEKIFIEETGSPVLGENNRASGRLLVLRDVTEAKLLEAYRDEITKMAVHDLRGPLGSIINAIKLTSSSLKNPSQLETAHKTLGLALDSANKLMDLVNSILDIAKLETRQPVLELAPVQIGGLVQNAYQALSLSAQKANVKIEFIIPPDTPSVNIDEDKIRRVFINLLDNALRFTPTNGLIQVIIKPEPEQSRILVQIADSGRGIPPEARERIFAKYEQVENNEPLRGSKGSGLGLTFCKLVIEAHGQHIWVEDNSPLSGACFAFTLPTSPLPIAS